LTSDPLTDFQLYRKPHPNRLKETSKLQVLPFLALWGVKYLGISRLYEEFLLAASTGTCQRSLSLTRDTPSWMTVRATTIILTLISAKETSSLQSFPGRGQRTEMGQHRVHRKF